MIRVVVIGAGLIGYERMKGIQQLAAEMLPVQLVGFSDTNSTLCKSRASEFKVPAYSSIEEVLSLDPDWVVIALPHDTAVPVAMDILKRGYSVLMEKPMGRDLHEARQLFELGGDRLKIGFNYRFFAGIRRVLQDARQGVFGSLIGIDLTVGHGCTPGQEKTWKLDPSRAGGGCLIDPGVHLLDLCLLLAPQKIEIIGGTSWAGFWKTGIEEDVQLLLRSGDGLSMSVQVSIVRWRSTFSFAVHGTEGYGLVTGRNRSYGPQTYKRGVRWGWRQASSQEASEVMVVQSDGMDVFTAELRALLFPGTSPMDAWPQPCTAQEALTVMEMLDSIRERLGLQREYALVGRV